MEYRPVEVKLVCAKDLKDVNVFSTMDVYVIGSVSGDPRSRQRTAVDKDGGTNPKWNHVMNFTFDEQAARANRLGLVFQIMSDRTLGDKEVGRVYVPLKELFETVGEGKYNEERHVVYQVQTPNGKFKGQLEFSFKFGEKYTYNVDRKLDDPVVAYPAGPGPVSGPGPSTAPGMGRGGGGAVPYGHREFHPYYPSQQGYEYGYGYGYGCGYPPVQHMPSAPNPHMGYGYGHPGGYGYPGHAPAVYMHQPVQKPKKSKFGLGTAAGVGAGLLGGLLVGEMVEDVAEDAVYDGMFDF